MARIRILKPFRFAHEGIRVADYVPGEQSVTERCAEVAIEEGWAVPADPATDTAAAAGDSPAPPAAPRGPRRKRSPGE